jgi:hypothetical protein
LEFGFEYFCRFTSRGVLVFWRFGALGVRFRVIPDILFHDSSYEWEFICHTFKVGSAVFNYQGFNVEIERDFEKYETTTFAFDSLGYTGFNLP